MISRFRIFISMVFLLTALAFGQNDVPWTGYVQVRYADGLQNTNTFLIRRIKLWSYQQTNFDKHLYYKVQAIFRYPVSGALILQDAFAEYRESNWWLRVGQETPDFSLQRNQPDFIIPFIERGKIIDALIPASESLARDIGMQFHLHPPHSPWSGSFGLFNGNGANVRGNEDQWLLLTTRQVLKFKSGETSHFESGISLSYRETSGIKFRHIFGSDTLFNGSDFRWGVEARWHDTQWDIQGEYINARLNDDVASGYYFLITKTFAQKHLLGLEYEVYKDLNPGSNDSPWYDVTYTYFLHKNKAKISTDFKVQKNENKFNYLFSLQTQLFFN